jgi:hypothetical protein
LDEELDAALGGGIPRGYLVEITGERYAALDLLSADCTDSSLLVVVRVKRNYSLPCYWLHNCRLPKVLPNQQSTYLPRQYYLQTVSPSCYPPTRPSLHCPPIRSPHYRAC